MQTISNMDDTSISGGYSGNHGVINRTVGIVKASRLVRGVGQLESGENGLPRHHRPVRNVAELVERWDIEVHFAIPHSQLAADLLTLLGASRFHFGGRQ